MQEARYFRGLSLILVFLLDNCLVKDINAFPTEFLNPWTRPPPLSPQMIQTRRTASGTPITYRLDAWSQYDNPEEGAEREGDIHETPQSRKTTTRNKNLLWPNGTVQYYIQSSIVNEPMKLSLLEDAMNIIMEKTCVKFVRINPDKDGQFPKNNWINITGHDQGCYSNLGRNLHGPTDLNLNVAKCFRTIGHSVHELLHALGVYHEHMRPDRDEYITIVWENIREGQAYNFKLMNDSEVTNYGLPYDYDSIMHYPMTAFSLDRSLPTIIPTTSGVEIGQRNRMSHYDVQKLLITYKCNATDSKNLKNAKKHKKKNNSTRHKKRKSHKKPTDQTKVKSQAKALTVHNPISNRLGDYKLIDDSDTPMDQTNHIDISRAMYPVQPDYYPVCLNYYPIYPHIHFYFYFYKRNKIW